MREYFDAFLSGGMIVSALMIVVWLMRIRSRGVTAYLFSVAFGLLGLLFWAFKAGWSQIWLYVIGGALGSILVADFLVRAAQQAAREDQG